MDTIFALSTAPGKAGVAVIRVSGPRADDAVRELCGDVPARRRAALRTLRDAGGHVLDRGLVLTFSEDHSFTGEKIAEFQIHGGSAGISAVLGALAGLDALRPAEAGEFTRRALENGRFDLAQVEGLADLIDAETEAQRRQAIRVFSGDLGHKVEGWRQKLIRAAALIEATIDFADEEVPVDVSPEVSALIDDVLGELRTEIAGVAVAERLRAGFEVAIVGAPNVGKSTLLNALAGRQAAITSEVAGTTRDVIEVRMDLEGLPVTFLDMAGIRETADKVESLGVARALDRAKSADLRVYLTLPGEAPQMPPEREDIIVIAKADLYPGVTGGISGRTRVGITELVERIARILSSRVAGSGLATRLRHKEALERGLVALGTARDRAGSGPEAADITAEELRHAIRALDSLIGRVDVETVLDEIFASFCLGK